jgi:hypothetical protein
MIGVGGVRGARAPARGRVFWSNVEKPEDAGQFARGIGGFTLEQTPPGAALQAADRGLARGVGGKENAYKITKPAWDFASSQFARGTEGEVSAVFGPNVKAGSTWRRIEEPILDQRRVSVKPYSWDGGR